MSWMRVSSPLRIGALIFRGRAWRGRTAGPRCACSYSRSVGPPCQADGCACCPTLLQSAIWSSDPQWLQPSRRSTGRASGGTPSPGSDPLAYRCHGTSCVSAASSVGNASRTLRVVQIWVVRGRRACAASTRQTCGSTPCRGRSTPGTRRTSSCCTPSCAPCICHSNLGPMSHGGSHRM